MPEARTSLPRPSELGLAVPPRASLSYVLWLQCCVPLVVRGLPGDRVSHSPGSEHSLVGKGWIHAQSMLAPFTRHSEGGL